MTKEFKIIPDANGSNSFAVEQATYIDTAVLVADTAQAFTVPAGYKFVMFSANGDFWADFHSTAAIPSSSVTNGSAPELNPTVRYLSTDVATISIIAPAATKVSLSYYK